LAKDVDFSGFRSQNPLIEKNQVGTRNIETQKIIVSVVEKNNVAVKTIPQIVESSFSHQQKNLSLVIWTQTQFPQTVRAELDSKIFEERQKDKQRLELESMLLDIKKILG
jgi:hypothetical protein